MKILNLLKSLSNYNKGRGKMLLPFFVLIASCSADPSHYGRVAMHNTANKNSFTFSVNDDFDEIAQKSKPDKKNPKITEAEARLLSAILKQQNYCINDGSNPKFIITSRQEKIYDMTFAHLIEQSYKARPITPRMYFGECKKD